MDDNKPKMGAPFKEGFTKKEFEKLCSFQCTAEEIAAWFDFSVDTLESRVKDEYNGQTFSEVFKQKRKLGHMSLRRKQYQKAVDDGDNTLLIWLGKQYLGQRDKHEEDKASEAINTETLAKLLDILKTRNQ